MKEQRQRRQLCTDFLRLRKGSVLEAMEASQLLREYWGIRIDWHEMSDALETLARCEQATRTGTGADGLTMYLIH